MTASSGKHHWQYRVVTYNYIAETPHFGIHEVYYDEDGAIAAWTEEPVRVVQESITALQHCLDKMQTALTLPVLRYPFDVEKGAGLHLIHTPPMVEEFLESVEGAEAVITVIQSHDWDDQGDHCLRCGDSDWFASKVCGVSDPQPEEGGCEAYVP